jgi:hypothetical protein
LGSEFVKRTRGSSKYTEASRRLSERAFFVEAGFLIVSESESYGGVNVDDGGILVWSKFKNFWIGAGEGGTVPLGINDEQTGDRGICLSDDGTGTGEE